MVTMGAYQRIWNVKTNLLLEAIFTSRRKQIHRLA